MCKLGNAVCQKHYKSNTSSHESKERDIFDLRSQAGLIVSLTHFSSYPKGGRVTTCVKNIHLVFIRVSERYTPARPTTSPYPISNKTRGRSIERNAETTTIRDSIDDTWR